MLLLDQVYMRLMVSKQFFTQIRKREEACSFVVTVSITIYTVVGFLSAAYPPDGEPSAFTPEGLKAT